MKDQNVNAHHIESLELTVQADGLLTLTSNDPPNDIQHQLHEEA